MLNSSHQKKDGQIKYTRNFTHRREVKVEGTGGSRCTVVKVVRRVLRFRLKLKIREDFREEPIGLVFTVEIRNLMMRTKESTLESRKVFNGE